MAKNGGMPDSMRTIMGWVLGLGIIAFILLILVIIFGSLSGNTGFASDTATFTNETIVLNSTLGDIPSTLKTTSEINPAIASIQFITNATGGEILTSDNYTFSGITITNATATSYDGEEVNVSATYSFDSQGQIDSDSIILNYTKSATNTSAQFPTVGTIIGIAILLLILIALLIFAIRRMMGVAGATGTTGGSNSPKFSGSTQGFG